MKRVLLVVATEAEATAFRMMPGINKSGDNYAYGEWEISPLITGVGSVATSWAMTKWISANTAPDLAINIGIAGSFREEITIGDVVMPVTDCFADAGIEDGDNFVTLSEAGLTDPDRFPFKNGRLHSDNQLVSKYIRILAPVNAITVNTATGSASTIEKLLKKYNADIETMEGAAFFYICMGENIPFLALRSVSNRVEPRNKDNWNIPLALEKLSEKLKEVFLTAY